MNVSNLSKQDFVDFMVKNFGEIQFDEGYSAIKNKMVAEDMEYETEDLANELGDIQFESTD